MTQLAAPRITPGGPREVGRLRWALLWLATRRRGGEIPNILLLLGRHRRVFMPWLWYASRLMPGGLLARADTELVILRVAARTRSDYEWQYHEAIATELGFDAAVIEWVAGESEAAPPPLTQPGIDLRRAALLRDATDELLATHNLRDETWAALAEHYDEPRLLELCMLVGQYAGLAATLNAARIPLDAMPATLGR